ncbi:MAG TPA: hypothetical protein ENK98_05225 [Epsilonproteobacteria bacterium]|nr:hypothetical protein [Campylobacterota bacterium]
MRKIIKIKYHFLVLIVELTLLLLALFLAYNFISMPAKKTTFYLNDNTITTLINTLNEKGYSTYAMDKYVVK